MSGRTLSEQESASKKGRRGRRRNTAMAAPPAAGSTTTEATPSRVRDLLAALQAAQAGTSLKQHSDSNTKTSRNSKESVATRMTRQAPSFLEFTPTRRTRNTSSSTYGNIAMRHSNNLVYQCASTSKATYSSRAAAIPEEVLDDLTFRFLLNIPESEKHDETRICFQIELAHWFYIDFYCKQEGRMDCHEISMRDFLKQIFAHSDSFRRYAKRADEIVDTWRLYKSTVPTYGAILLDSTLNFVLLVQGYYASKNSWGFPKGKVNENEQPRACAVREVAEETGFDFGQHSKGREHKIQKFINDTMIRLYIVTDVPTNYAFAPRTRCEIRQMKWFSVWDLPADRSQQLSKANHLGNFYTVLPFVQDLQTFIKREQALRESKKREAPTGPIADLATCNEKTSAFTRVLPKNADEKIANSPSLFITPQPYSPQQSRVDTLFRPLTGTAVVPLGKKVPWMGPSTPLAHPLPIQLPSARPVYIAPAEIPPVPKKRSSPICLPSTSSWNCLGTACSATELEEKLQKMLMSSTSEDSEESGTERQREAETQSSVEEDEDDEEMSRLHDNSRKASEAVSDTTVVPSFELPYTALTPSRNGDMSPIDSRGHFKLIPAWNSFQLDKRHVFY